VTEESFAGDTEMDNITKQILLAYDFCPNDKEQTQIEKYHESSIFTLNIM
jgi:hypothetical protein